VRQAEAHQRIRQEPLGFHGIAAGFAQTINSPVHPFQRRVHSVEQARQVIRVRVRWAGGFQPGRGGPAIAI